MEADPGKQRSRQKRRERTLQLQQEKQTREEEEASGQDDQDGSPPRSSKDKPPRSKPNKIKSALFEEDIIDGFAIMSFKTFEELESVTKKNGCIKNKSVKPQDNNSDTLSLDKDDNVKTKKKKVKKSPSINSCSNNGGGNNGDDSNTGNNAGSNTVNNTPTDIGDTISNLVHSDHHHHPNHHHIHHHNGPLEPPRSISRDRLSDASTHSGSGQGYVCDVESEDDKASESGSDLYSGIPSSGLLNHLPNNGHPNPCVALTAPTPPPSTSSTPTPLCNGIGGTTSHSSSPVPHILVASTSTTSTTTTSSTSRPGLSETLTNTTTSPAVTSSAIPSVIHTTPYNPQRPVSKPPQFSPGSSIQSSTRPLSPSSQQGSLVGDTSSCARSLQYSKSLKANHIHGHNTKGVTHVHPSGHLSNNTSNLPHHLHQLQQQQQQQQQQYGDNPQPFHLQNGPSNLNPSALSQTQLNSSFPFQSPTSGSGYSSPYPGYSSTLRPDPLVNPRPLTLASSPRPDQRCPSVVSSGSQSTPLNNVSLSTATPGAPHLITTPVNHHPQHISQHKSSGRSDPSHPHQQYHQSRHSSPSPGYPQKRVCRTPPGLPPSTSSSSSSTWTTSAPINDTCKKFTPPLPPRGQTKPDQLVSGSGKDSDKPRIKDSSGHHHHSQHHQSKDHRDREREKEKEREKQRTPVSSSSSLTPTSFPTAKPAWPSSPGQLYPPLLHSHHHSPLTPTSGLHPLGPPSSSVAPQTSPLFPLPLAPPPPLLAAGAPSLTSGMFAPPIAPAPSSLASAPLPTHAASPSQFSTESLIRSQQDFLHQDLNNRLLAHRDSTTIGLPSTQFVRNETHQHQHQHQHLHNHMHQHTYGGLSASPLVPAGPPLFDKLPKVYDTGVFRPSLVPSYSAAFSSLLQPGPSGASIASSLQGAFQPKNLVAPGQMLVPFRDREKAVPPPGLPPVQKKQGKWCAVHVRVAWEIYHRQQKQQRDPDSLPGTSSKSGPDTKPLEPSLRPASHLLPSSRPPELAPPPPTSLLSSVARSVPDGIVHPSSSFLASNLVSGMSAFPRPAPYPQPSLLNPLGFSGLDCVVYHHHQQQHQQDMHRNNMHLFPGSSMFAPVRDMGPPGLHAGLSSSPHGDWRLHRAPSSFPTWPKSELEKEKDREKDRERELRKEEERERERRSSTNHRLPGVSDESRHKDTDSSRPKSRSRSRSPLRNGHGRLDHHVKSELGHYDRRYEEKLPMSSSSSLSNSAMKLKDERREEELLSLPHHLEREKIEREKIERERLERDRLERDRMERDRMERDRMERERIEKEKILHSAAAAEREKILQAVEQREKFLQTSGYLGLSPFGAGLHTHPGLLDRRMGLMGPPGVGYPFLDRPPVPTTMWSPFDKTVEMAHRVEMERERERMAMMSRLSSIPSHVAALEQERLKEQLIREQQEREYELRRQYLDRLPAFSADRLRAADPLALSGYFPRTISPMFGPGALAGLKSNSPHMSGVPPPLIPSSSTATMLSSRSHDNSPSSSSKSKGCSPADSTSDLKDKREGNSTDPDTHSR